MCIKRRERKSKSSSSNNGTVGKSKTTASPEQSTTEATATTAATAAAAATASEMKIKNKLREIRNIRQDNTLSSAMYRQIEKLAGDTFTPSMVFDLWKDRLPYSIRSILSLNSVKKMRIDDLLRIVDKQPRARVSDEDYTSTAPTAIKRSDIVELREELRNIQYELRSIANIITITSKGHRFLSMCFTAAIGVLIFLLFHSFLSRASSGQGHRIDRRHIWKPQKREEKNTNCCLLFSIINNLIRYKSMFDAPASKLIFFFISILSEKKILIFSFSS